MGKWIIALGATGCSSGGGDVVTYCDVVPVFESRCTRCHTVPNEHGAPFPLHTYASTQAQYAGDPVYERMATAVAEGEMPPLFLNVEPPVEDITEEEVDMILDWVEAGAPRGECE